jgi:hypothetical protein
LGGNGLVVRLDRKEFMPSINWIQWFKPFRRPVLAAVCVFLLVDCLLVDRLQVVGHVVDKSTGKAIADAWVVVEFYGEKPLINLPIPPHPNNRTTACMGSRLAKTNRFGWFLFDEITINRQLANKSASILVFKPHWLTEAQSTDVSTSLLALPSIARLNLGIGPGEKKVRTRRDQNSDGALLPTSEYMRSEELFDTLSIVMYDACSLPGFELSVVAMRHGVEIAETYDERDRTRSACISARNSIAKANESRAEAKHWFRRFEPDYVWPFDCDNLPFKKPPSPEVLAVEARDRADREARLRAQGEIP